MFVLKMSVFVLFMAAATVFAAGWLGEQVADLLTRGTP